MRQWRKWVSQGLLLLAIAGSDVVLGSATDEYRAGVEAWHQQRAESLSAENGWLSLIGLFWLHEGANTMGSDPGADIVLPAGKSPSQAGVLDLAGGRVILEVDDAAAITHDGQPVSSIELAVDTTGEPTVLDLGDLQFLLIDRSGKYGLRIRDRQHPARFDFPGIERFPIDADWRITGHLETYDPPRSIPIPNVLGQVNPQESPGTAIFEVEGQTYRIDALQGSRGRLYLIFGDQTSGRETYGGGRFLYSEPVAADGTVVIDFNKAYNPPCAFTDYATCPLPPRQNKLSIRIEAGEMKYGEDH